MGGSSIHVRDICKKLMDTDVESTVVIGGEGYFAEHMRQQGISVHSLPELQKNINPIQDLRSYFKLKRVIKEINPDLISTHSSKIGFLGRLAAHSLKIPVLFTAHGWSFRDGVGFLSHHIYKRLENFAALRTDRIICVSNYDMEIGAKYLSVHPERLNTIHNGMPDIPSQQRSNPEMSNPVNIIMIARFDLPKDHIQLLEALQPLEGFHLHFVGDGPLMAKSIQKAKDLGLEKKVTFYGRREDVSKLLSNAQFFVLISNLEGFPLSTLEAMRAGLPVIVSDVGGAAEAIEEGVTGYSVPRGDLNILRDRIKLLIADAKLRKKMGQAGRKRYEEFFTFDQMFEKNYRIYEEVLTERKKI